MLKQLQKLLGIQPLAGLEQLLEEVQSGSLSVEGAADQIRKLAAQPHIPPWFPRLFGLMGVMFAIGGIGFTAYSVYFSIGTEEAAGTVIQMKGEELQRPVVEYEVNGKMFTFHSSMSSSPPAYGVGDKVSMLYHLDNPKSAQVNSFIDRWLFPIAFTSVGLGAVAVSFAIPRLVRTLTGAE